MAEIDFDEAGPRPDGRTARGCWRGYFEAAVPKGAGPEQIQATRDAFYAGFVSCLSIINGLARANLPDDVGVAILDRLMREQLSYLDQIKRRPRVG